MHLDAVNVVRSFFLAGAGAGIFLNSVPWLSKNFLSYGNRAQNSQQVSSASSKANSPLSKVSSVNGIVGWIQTGVPHSWFIHYYIFTVALSAFWGYQLLAKGAVFRAVAQHVDVSATAATMKPHQTMLIWLLMFVQGLRRLLETKAFTKPSASRMPWSIYAIGIAYYAAMSVAVWVEGTKSIMSTPSLELALVALPSLRTTLGLIVFTLASGIQHDCHAYLADLKKYTLPEHPSFQKIVCPHYTAELVLYIALAVIGAPRGQWINRTLLCNVIWTFVNLGIVADESKRWSEAKFGRERVSHRARMIPGVW